MSENLSEYWSKNAKEIVLQLTTCPGYMVPMKVNELERFLRNTFLPKFEKQYGYLLNSGNKGNASKLSKDYEEAQLVIGNLLLFMGEINAKPIIDNMIGERLESSSDSFTMSKKDAFDFFVSMLKLGVNTIVLFYPYISAMKGKGSKDVDLEQVLQVLAKALIRSRLVYINRFKESKQIPQDALKPHLGYINHIEKNLKTIENGYNIGRAVKNIENWDKIEKGNREIDRLKALKSKPVEKDDEVKGIEEEITRKENERNSLGFFKFSEKKEMLAEIEELKLKKENAMQELKRKRDEDISEQIRKVFSEISQYS